MSNDEKKNVVLRIVDFMDVEESEDRSEENLCGPDDPYEVNMPDLREIADRVFKREGIKDKFIEMYLSMDDMSDCSLHNKGFNLYSEDEDYMYVYTVIKKDEIE